VSSDRLGTSDPVPVRRSQVSLATVFTVCFGVAIVAGLVLFLLETKVALVLTLGGAIAAVARPRYRSLLERPPARVPGARTTA
jgi:hypothetical protein